MRPDPTPPDASLFPIAPTFTADLDARALDEIVEAFKKGRPQVEAVAGLLEDIEAAIRTTGREV